MNESKAAKSLFMILIAFNIAFGFLLVAVSLALWAVYPNGFLIALTAVTALLLILSGILGLRKLKEIGDN